MLHLYCDVMYDVEDWRCTYSNKNTEAINKDKDAFYEYTLHPSQ